MSDGKIDSYDQPAHTQTSTAPAPAELPEPRVKKMRWPFPLIWLVPVLAAVGSGYYLYMHKAEHGQHVAVTFSKATDLKVGDTPVVVHGVKVGAITSITLADDQMHAIVNIDLKLGVSRAANRGTKFWIVHPDVAGGSLNGLSTLISGPYIEALPGDGPVSTEFTGLDDAPVVIGDGMRLVLTADHLEHLQVNSGVYYRGIQVGAVQDIRLAGDSSHVNATVVLWRRYAALVRSTSKFWSVNGADVKGGLFSGIQFQVNSIRTLIAGGVAFATPDAENGDPAVDGMIFGLYPEADKKWQQWQPHIAIDQPVFDPNPAESDSDKGKDPGPVKMK